MNKRRSHEFHETYAAGLLTGITLFILIGPAVADTANGKAVWMAFAVRICLFLAVSLYGWAAMKFLEFIHERNRTKQHP